MSSEIVDRIARAVLYEGYLLYPYRHSAFKNQQRWNFGVLYPGNWAANQIGQDRSYFQMECLALGSDESDLEVAVRFLHLTLRDAPGETYQEALERKITVGSIRPAELARNPRHESFSVHSSDKEGEEHRRTLSIECQIEISTAHVKEHVFRLTLLVRNTTAWNGTSRNDALMHSLVSAHAVLHIRKGEFISQIDPPEELRDAVAACQNTGVWPVLVGASGSRDWMLGSPIILYDYPQVAPESRGDLFDATEIDEILTLRILTLTDEEKEEVRRSDDRARQILERLETSPAEHLLQLHGTIRGMREPRGDAWSDWDTLEGTPVKSAAVSGVPLKKGDRVRLRPRKRADIFDTLLDGRIAVIEAVEEDFEHNIHLAVVLEDDPGRDLGEIRQAGHRFFFSTEEVEPVVEPVNDAGSKRM